MSLPAANTPWPPREYAPALAKIAEHDAWYSGDPERLHRLYRDDRNGVRNRPSQYRGGIIGMAARMWWGRPLDQGTTTGRLHVPAAADLATMSSDLLFGETPKLTAAPAGNAEQATAGAQDRLDELAERVNLPARLSEAGEVSAAHGGVFLRVWWDKELQPDGPMLQAVHADRAFPEFVAGVLRAVTFVNELLRDDRRVVRHLERHEPGGIILHAVYEGTPENLGKPRPLAEYEATRGLAEQITAPGGLMPVAYLPNMLPNAQDRGSWIGRSDYSRSEPLFDWLDETYTSWRRDIRLAKARIIVPDGYMQSNGPGLGATFDTEREAFTELNIPPMSGSNASPITLAQFKIRVAEHKDTSREIMQRIVANAGYSAGTFGLDDQGVPPTATEIRARQRRSFGTRDKKTRYATPALRHIGRVLLAVDADHFGGRFADAAVSVSWPDGVQVDMLTLAQTAQALRTAEAASDDTIVRLVHPDWPDDRVKAEVAELGKAREVANAPLPDPGDSFPD